MLRDRRAGLVFALAALAAWPARPSAAELQVSPIVVDLGRARSALVSVRNVGRAPARFQVRAFDWAESPLGEMKLEPATDLVAFPTVLEIAPGQDRKLRVGTTAEPGERERTWRVFLEEILPAETRSDTTRIRTRLRVGIPVFLAPARPISGAEIAGLGVERAKVTFLLRNAGTVRIRPTVIRVSVQDVAGTSIFEKTLDGWYVLAGGDRLYQVDLPDDVCARASAVTATAVGEVPVESTRPVVGGACAR